MKKLISLFLIAMLLGCITATHTAAISDLQSSHEEAILHPVQISETTFAYYDEDENLIAYWENLSEEVFLSNRTSNGERISWAIKSGSYQHGNYYFSNADGITVEVDIDSSSSSANAYLGIYNGRADKYSWFDTPSTTGFHSRLTFTGNTSNTIAIKNVGPAASTFSGYYATVS